MGVVVSAFSCAGQDVVKDLETSSVKVEENGQDEKADGETKVKAEQTNNEETMPAITLTTVPQAPSYKAQKKQSSKRQNILQRQIPVVFSPGTSSNKSKKSHSGDQPNAPVNYLSHKFPPKKENGLQPRSGELLQKHLEGERNQVQRQNSVMSSSSSHQPPTPRNITTDHQPFTQRPLSRDSPQGSSSLKIETPQEGNTVSIYSAARSHTKTIVIDSLAEQGEPEEVTDSPPSVIPMPPKTPSKKKSYHQVHQHIPLKENETVTIYSVSNSPQKESSQNHSPNRSFSSPQNPLQVVTKTPSRKKQHRQNHQVYSIEEPETQQMINWKTADTSKNINLTVIIR